MEAIAIEVGRMEADGMVLRLSARLGDGGVEVWLYVGEASGRRSGEIFRLSPPLFASFAGLLGKAADAANRLGQMREPRPGPPPIPFKV